MSNDKLDVREEGKIGDMHVTKRIGTGMIGIEKYHHQHKREIVLDRNYINHTEASKNTKIR